MLKKNQRGVVLLEFAIYFPIAIFLFAGFISTAFVLTQRVVLDRAVARATQEGAMWLSTTMHYSTTGDPFAGGQTIGIRSNPYLRFGRVYGPTDEVQFKSEMERRVRAYANQGLFSRNTNIQVNVDYRNFVVAGDLKVSVSADVAIPIVPAFTNWQITSSASARVMRPASLMNDVGFIFDAVRHVAGWDINRLSNVVANTTDSVNNLLRIAERFN